MNRQTYSIYFEPTMIGRNLNMDDIRKADTLGAGMLEQVLENLICWHDLKAKDLNRVMTYISLELGHPLVTIEEEHYCGCTCRLDLVCAVQL